MRSKSKKEKSSDRTIRDQQDRKAVIEGANLALEKRDRAMSGDTLALMELSCEAGLCTKEDLEKF